MNNTLKTIAIVAIASSIYMTGCQESAPQQQAQPAATETAAPSVKAGETTSVTAPAFAVETNASGTSVSLPGINVSTDGNSANVQVGDVQVTTDGANTSVTTPDATVATPEPAVSTPETVAPAAATEGN
jgi:hypothetical protein